MAPSTRVSHTFTISLPPDLAAKAEFLARRDSRTISELFREALRTYYTQDARQSKALEALPSSTIAHQGQSTTLPRFHPVSIAGEPLSETILRDRGDF